MSFADLPDRGEFLLPSANEFSQRLLAMARQVVATHRTVLDVEYGDDFYHKLDIYLPEDQHLTGLPVLLFIHGGAWRHGFKEWMGFMAPPITSLPAVFVSINYRLAPEGKYPQPLDDCVDALAWVYRNIESYGGDSNRIFVAGHSAGGHLAALVGLRKDYAVARDMPADVVKACFPSSSPLNLHLDEIEPGGRREKAILLLLARREDDRDASPIDHVEGNTTPVYLTYGENDLPEVVEHNKQMIELMKQQPCVFEYKEFAGYDHFRMSEDCQDPDFEWVRKVREWMVKTPTLAAA